MRRFAQAGMIAIMAVGAMAQQPGPWSEQLPQPQRPDAQGQYPQGPPQYQGQPGPPSGLGPNVNPNAGPTDDQGNAPDRGVARVSFMNGNVSVRRGDSGELVAAVVSAWEPGPPWASAWGSGWLLA